MHRERALEIRTPQAILQAHAKLLDRLRLHAACDEAHFSLRFVAPLLRLARHVNVLPATEGGLFSDSMGLFRACLEAGFFSFQASDGHIFTGSEGVERRHALEGRWRYVCFLAALFHPLGKPLQRVVLVQAEGLDWKHSPGGATAWAESAGVDSLLVAWTSSEDAEAIGPSAITLPVVPQVVGPENLHMIEEGAGELVTALCELAVGEPGTSPIARETVTSCWARISEREAAARCLPRAGPSNSQAVPASQPPSRYADLLPSDLRDEIAASSHAEGLGKVVHAWRSRDEASAVMRRVAQGAAIEFNFLTTAIANVPIWLDAMARCGLVHAPPNCPGQRIQKVAMAEGQPPVQALVLSNLACRRLGL